jgi:hypothetical protein
MDLKATVSSDYRWRLGLVGALVLFFSLWFLYDGTVGYPAKRERFNAYQKMVVDRSDYAAWRNYAIEQGFWSPADPGDPPQPDAKDNKSDWDIAVQLGLGILCLPIGVTFLWTWFRSGRWWIAFDGQTLTTSWGRPVPIAQIKSIDATRWKTKGIAMVHYEQAGKPGRLVLDDWKFLRTPTAEIYRQVVQHLDPASSENVTPPAGDPDDAPRPTADAG